MPYPKRICVVCSEEFELRPDKPGFANRCPSCSMDDEPDSNAKGTKDASNPELNAERRKAMRDLLYRKDS